LRMQVSLSSQQDMASALGYDLGNGLMTHVGVFSGVVGTYRYFSTWLDVRLGYIGTRLLITDIENPVLDVHMYGAVEKPITKQISLGAEISLIQLNENYINAYLNKLQGYLVVKF